MQHLPQPSTAVTPEYKAVLPRLRSDRFARWLGSAAHADTATITGARRVWGGSSRDTWRVSVIFRGGPYTCPCELLVRMEAWRARAGRLTLRQQAGVMHAARSAGVPAPEPLWFCGDPRVIGRPFLIVPWLAGTADRQVIAEMTQKADGGRELIWSLGAHLAAIHAISLQQPGLAFLGSWSPKAIPARWCKLYTVADIAADLFPTLAEGLRWLERHVPEPTAQVLTHGDFGTGNYLVADGAVAAILDWENASRADPHRDIAGFWAKARRRKDWGAQGEDPTLRQHFQEGYASAGGGPIDEAALRYWEVVSHMRSAATSLSRVPMRRSHLVQGALIRRTMDALDQVALLIA